MAKLLNVTAAHIARISPQMHGAVDMTGVFETIVQPIFPVPMMNLALVVTIADLLETTEFELRLNTPSQDLMSKAEFKVAVGAFGIGKKIINFEKILIVEQGVYTVDIFEKNGEKIKFMGGTEVFIAGYPPQRNITDEMKAEILKDETLIRRVRTEFSPITDRETTIKVQFALDPDEEVMEGYTPCPENDLITVNGKEYELTGLRRQCEWMYGQKIPTELDVVDENEIN